MYTIKFPGPVKFSGLFSLKCFACASLKNYGKNVENFPGSLKLLNAKHLAFVMKRQMHKKIIIAPSAELFSAHCDFASTTVIDLNPKIMDWLLLPYLTKP